MQKFFQVLINIVIIFVICGCHSKSTQQIESMTKVKGIMLPYLSFAPFFIAVEENYFVERNIDFEVVELQRGVQAVPQLLLGQIDVSAGILDAALINGISRGRAPKIVANKGVLASDNCSHIGVLQNPDIPVYNWKNSRIAVRLNSFNGYYLQKLLNSKHLKLEDIIEVNIPWQSRITAISEKSIDLVVAGEPWIQKIIETTGAELIHSAEQVLPNVSSAFVFYSDEFMKERPQVAQNFMAAYLKGVKEYSKGKTASNLMAISKHTKIDTSQLKKVCWPSIDLEGKINEQGLLAYQDWLMERNMIDEKMSIDSLWDDRFISSAKSILKN